MPAVILVGKQGRVVKGGPGSGFHGHAGRPGERGGSQARPNPLEEAMAKLKEAGVQRTVDTGQVDNLDLGRAAYIEDGKLITYHVTDDAAALLHTLDEHAALRGGTDHSELGSGLYGSTVPDYWMGRSTDKYSFLNKLDKGERIRLADLLQQQLDRAKGQFITPSEYDRGVRNLHAFVEQNSHYGAVSLAEQPYNFRFWKPDWLTEHGFEPGKQPAIVRIEARGVFAEVDRSLGETGSQKLIDLGFDGAYMVGGWSNDPQVVIWNPKAIVGYSEEETTVKAFFLTALGYLKGGDGSGNFDHAGRPGERGGSAPSATPDWWAKKKSIFDVMFGSKDIALDEEIGTAILPDGMEAKVRADAVAALHKATKLPAAEIDDLFTQWEEGANTQSGLGTLGIQAVASQTFKAPLSAWQKKRFEENSKRVRADFGKRFAQALMEGETPDAALKTATDGIDDHDLYPFQLAALNKLKAPSSPTAAQALAYYDKSVTQANAQTEKLLKAMYDRTQQAFKDAGLRALRVYRGVTLLGQKWQAGDAVKPDLNAISSWTVLGQAALKDFATEPGSYVLERSILPEHVLALPTTGFGKLTEGEILILGTAGNQGVFVRSKTGKAFTTVKGGEGSGYFHHAGVPGHRGGSAPDGLDTLTGGPAESAAPAAAPAAAPTHGLTLPTVNLRNRPAVHKQLDSFLASSPALSKVASSRQPLPRAALAPIPEKHLAEVMRATGTDSKLPTKQNLAIGAKSLYMPVAGQDELDAYMEQRLKEKGPRSAAGSGGGGGFFKPSPAKGANAHAQLKKDAKVADGKKLEKTRKKTREETRGLLLSAVEEAARTGNWQSANALQIKYELAGGLETFALLMGYQAVDGGTETGILVLDRSALVMNPTPIVGVTPPEPPRSNIQTPLPHQVPGLGRGRLQTPLPRGGAITKGGTGSGNFQHQGIPGHRGGSAPNGGPQEAAGSVVDLMTAGWSAPDFAYLDREADWVKALTAKRDAFLAEARTLPKLAPLRERYVGLVQTLQAVEHPEQYPQWVENLKKAEQDYEGALQERRDLFVKHFGNETAQRLGYSPLTPDLKGTPVAQEIKTGQTFLNQTVANWPTKTTGKKKLLRYDVYYSTQRAHFDGGSVVLAHSDKANTVVHETGHFLEAEGKTRDGIPYHHVALNFLEARTAGEYPKSLKLLTGNAYGDGELARPDKFLHPYIGREYPDGKATEVLSMGMEFLYNNPVKFASGDEEHFYLTVGMLQGVIAVRPRTGKAVGYSGRIVKGGPGSGNFGHAGRIGEIGGSQPQGEVRQANPNFKPKLTKQQIWLRDRGLPLDLLTPTPKPAPVKRPTPKPMPPPPPPAPVALETPVAKPTATPTGFAYLDPQVAWVKTLQAKRAAFLADVDALPDWTNIRTQYEEASKKAWVPGPEKNEATRKLFALEKQYRAGQVKERNLFLKHFGQDKALEIPVGKVDELWAKSKAARSLSTARTFLGKLAGDWPFGRPAIEIDPKAVRSYVKGGTITLWSQADTHTAVHELGHFLEDRQMTLDGVPYNTLFQRFVDARTQGETPRPLRALTGKNDFDVDEMATPDHFIDPYIGLRPHGKRAYTEVLSMGLDTLYTMPSRLARDDEEMFYLVVGAARHTLVSPRR